jgi:small subunit ribosomal protein S11
MATAKNAAAAGTKKVVRRRREKKNIDKGQVHIRSSFNNTMVTVTDTQGNAISWAPPAAWASAAARSPRPSQRRPQLRPPPAPPWSTD